MPIIEGTTQLKVARGEYSFATDGGAVSTITLRGAGALGGQVPSGSIIIGGYIEVDTILASGGSATVAVGLESTTDLLAATAFGSAPWSSTGRKSVIPVGTGVTTVKATASRSITITIATAALTAGIFRVVLEYI
jgi:hypothetical protein